MTTVGSNLLNAVRVEFLKQKTIGEAALAQLRDEDLAWMPYPGGNSALVLVKHLAGNMRSRWVDFLTSDGEKPDRDRDSEFVVADLSRSSMLVTWEDGWAHLFRTLGSLTDHELMLPVRIRGQTMSVIEAILRQLTHYAYHVGQIVQVARQRAGSDWHYLSIPPGQSADYLPESQDSP